MSFDASSTLPLDSESLEMSARYQPIDGHPGFYRHGTSVAFRYKLRSGRNRWASAPTIRAAKKLQEELRTDARRGKKGGPTPRFDRYARAWIDSYAGRTSRGLRETTRDSYRRQLERFAIPYFGSTRLEDVSPIDVRDFAQHVAKRVKQTTGRPAARDTVRLALAPVKALLATARDDEIIPMNPSAGVRLLMHQQQTSSDERAKAWSAGQLAALIAKLPDAWRLFALFLAETGLRFGEAAELRWGDVDLGARLLRVERSYFRGHVGPPKSAHARRRLRLSEELARALWEHRKQTHASDSDLIFTGPTSSWLHAGNLADVFKAAAIAAGVPWLGFHGFRHTCATALFREGGNVKQVQAWLGHHSPAFTLETYVHLLPEDLPEPPSFASSISTTVRHFCDTNATQTGRNVTNRARAETAN